MHKKTPPQSVCHWSWWLNSHVLLLSTLQSVPQGPDVLTAVLLLWQNNTSGFVSGACGENPQNLVPPLLSSCSFCTVQNEPAALEPLQCQNSRSGHSQETHLEELTFIPLDTKPDLLYIHRRCWSCCTKSFTISLSWCSAETSGALRLF